VLQIALFASHISLIPQAGFSRFPATCRNTPQGGPNGLGSARLQPLKIFVKYLLETTDPKGYKVP
jgi:hypothetical protein